MSNVGERDDGQDRDGERDREEVTRSRASGLWHRDLALLWSGQFLARVAAIALGVTAAFQLKHLEESPAVNGWLAWLAVAPGLACTPLAGLGCRNAWSWQRAMSATPSAWPAWRSCSSPALTPVARSGWPSWRW